MSRLIRSVDWVLILVMCIAALLGSTGVVQMYKARAYRKTAADKGEILIRVDKAYYSCKDTGIRW